MAKWSPYGTVEHEDNWLFAVLLAQIYVVSVFIFEDDGLGGFANPLGAMINRDFWWLLVHQEREGKHAGERHCMSLPSCN